MEWQDQLRGDSLAWSLEDDSPGVRYLAMRDLLDLPASDAKLRAARKQAHKDGPIAAILDQMEVDGYWVSAGPGYNPKYRSTVWSIILLAQLGASITEDKRIAQACRYVLDHTLTATGQFSTSGAPSGTVDCLQGNLCWALQQLGCDDNRLDIAVDWMARTVTGEGISPASDRDAPVRYYAAKSGPVFSCGANNKLSCAWGGVKVMLALSQLPPKKHTPVVDRAILQGSDFLLSIDPASAAYPSMTGKPNASWWKFGFPVFYVTDVLQNIEALANLVPGSDPRLQNAVNLILDKQDAQGRWHLDYDYIGKTSVDFGPRKAANKWVTLRALRTLKRLHHAKRSSSSGV